MTRDLVGYGRDYPTMRWPDGARIVVSIVVHVEEGAERSILDGDDDTESADGSTVAEGAVSEGKRRDLQIESLFEYGARRGFWRLYEDSRQGTKSRPRSFAAGWRWSAIPAAARAIAEGDHEAVAHGYRWLPQVAMSREEENAEIERALRAVEGMTGQRVQGWASRMPSTSTRELLQEHGLLYDSDSYGDDLPYGVGVNGRTFVTVPYTMDANDDRFWMTPQASGFSNPHHFHAVMRRTFDCLYAEGAQHPKMMSVGLHPRISGRPSRARLLDRFITYAKGHPGVLVARRGDIARWWLARQDGGAGGR